jgi:hypothetical protein
VLVQLAEKARRTYVALAHYPPALAVNIPFVSCERDLEGIVARHRDAFPVVSCFCGSDFSNAHLSPQP